MLPCLFNVCPPWPSRQFYSSDDARVSEAIFLTLTPGWRRSVEHFGSVSKHDAVPSSLVSRGSASQFEGFGTVFLGEKTLKNNPRGWSEKENSFDTCTRSDAPSVDAMALSHDSAWRHPTFAGPLGGQCPKPQTRGYRFWKVQRSTDRIVSLQFPHFFQLTKSPPANRKTAWRWWRI